MEFEGTIVNRNNRAKEMVLYKVIAEKDAEIVRLNENLDRAAKENIEMFKELSDVRSDLKAMKSKEYRRTVRKKKAKAE